MVGPPRLAGRYAIHAQIAAGGIATVHLGRQLGAAGFSRIVAIKRLHPQFAAEPEFVSMFVDEARLATRFRHPNVVPTLDIVSNDGELFLVMEYVHGATLARLMRNMKLAGERVALPVAAAVMSGVLRGLHAAHEARSERGEPLDMVHRDVSPQNIMVGTDGMPRVLDFGIAKAVGRLHTTRKGELKGKFGYMAPEQLEGRAVTRRCDVYAASVVAWELLAGRRLFDDVSERGIVRQVLEARVEPPSAHAPSIPPELDEIVMRGLARDPEQRFATAADMANDLDATIPGAIAPTVAAWVEQTAEEELAAQASLVAELDLASDGADAKVGSTLTASRKASQGASAGSGITSGITFDTMHPGQVVAGKYRIERVLGSGAMGKVLAATHLQLDAKVALKVMLPEIMTSPGVSARFLREARAVVRLKSEHVAKVHDLGALDDGTPYIVMELLEGRDLGAMLADGQRFSVEEAAEYVLHACDALAEAHAQGIVHRDVKPANLFVTRRSDGTPVVKVLDFGISKASALDEPASPATSRSVLLGSPHYMSPEQFKSARDVDARADVWSLGIMLYEFASGRVPFTAGTLGQLMAKVLTETPPPLRALQPGVPEDYAKLVDSCLEKDVQRRCASVGTVARMLSPFTPARSRHIVDRVTLTLAKHATAKAVTTEPAQAATGAPGPSLPTEAGTVVSPPLPPAGAIPRAPWERSPGSRRGIALAAVGVVVLGAIAVGTVMVTRHGELPGVASPPVTALASATAAVSTDTPPPPSSVEPEASGVPSAPVTLAEPNVAVPEAGPMPAHPKRPGTTPTRPPAPKYNPLDHL